MTVECVGICSQCGHPISGAAAFSDAVTRELFHYSYSRSRGPGRGGKNLIKTPCGPIKKLPNENNQKRP